MKGLGSLISRMKNISSGQPLLSNIEGGAHMHIRRRLMAIDASILAWKIPWREEPGRLHTVHGVSKSWS